MSVNTLASLIRRRTIVLGLTAVALALVPGTGLAGAAPCEQARLPWPPTPEQRQRVAAEIRASLERSEVPEAKELLAALPPSDTAPPEGSEAYFGEWKRADDGCTLWTGRIHNEVLRRQYEIRFRLEDGTLVAADLAVITAHARR